MEICKTIEENLNSLLDIIEDVNSISFKINGKDDWPVIDNAKEYLKLKQRYRQLKENWLYDDYEIPLKKKSILLMRGLEKIFENQYNRLTDDEKQYHAMMDPNYFMNKFTEIKDGQIALLNLSYENLKYIDFVILMDVVRNSEVEELNLTKNTFGVSHDAMIILIELMQHSNVKKLLLAQNTINDYCMKELFQVLHLTKLEFLDIHDNSLTPKFEQEIPMFIESLEKIGKKIEIWY